MLGYVKRQLLSGCLKETEQGVVPVGIFGGKTKRKKRKQVRNLSNGEAAAVVHAKIGRPL